MNSHDQILILGASGMVGAEIGRQLLVSGESDLLTPTRQQLNLESQQEVEDYFSTHHIKQVYFCAASAGSIEVMAKSSFSILQSNLLMQQNVISAAFKSGIKRMIYFSSSCIYPENEERIMREDDLFSGEFPVAQRAYGLSKVAGTMLCQSYNRQYGTEYLSLVPCGIYGGKRSLESASPQVLPALIKRMDQAVRKKQKEFVVWGTGNPVREFIHVVDVARAAIMLMNKEHLQSDTYNIGSGTPVTISQLTTAIASVLNYQGTIQFDQSKPDGAKFKMLSSDKLRAEGWAPTIDLDTGLKKTLDLYRQLPNNFNDIE